MRVESPDHGVCLERTVFSNAWFVCSLNRRPQIAIGLQVLLGALTTGLSAAISGRKVCICGLKNTTVNAENILSGIYWNIVSWCVYLSPCLALLT
jgi:hypothetical protein